MPSLATRQPGGGNMQSDNAGRRGNRQAGQRRRCHIWPNSNAINTYAICSGRGGEHSPSSFTSTSPSLLFPYSQPLLCSFVVCVLWPFPCSFVSKPLHAFPPIRHLTLVNFQGPLEPTAGQHLWTVVPRSFSFCFSGESCTRSHGNLS